MRSRRRLSLDELAPNLLLTSAAQELLTPARIFGDERPMEIEVGSGKGLFLLESATAHPEVNYLGIEIDRKHQLFAATRLAKRGLANARLACADAREFFRDHLASACCQAIHVYFPDPWWKQRHRKRRVFTEDFAHQCERVLAPLGTLALATDVEEYYRVMLRVVESATSLSLIASAIIDPSTPPQAFSTNFERKALARGTQVFRAQFRAVSG